jgi:hypothetical protein
LTLGDARSEREEEDPREWDSSLTPDSDLPVDETVKQAAGAGIRL